MSKYRVCDDVPRHCKTFNNLKDLIEWANEEILKNKEIKVGDIVTIEKYGDIYDTLDVTYFQELWDSPDIDVSGIFKLMIHYDYGRNYGVGTNPNREKDRIRWEVLFIHNERVFIERYDFHVGEDPNQILCIKKSGLKKFEEV